MAWIDVAAAGELARAGKLIVRHEGRQILLLDTQAGLFACVNRCPHEGYPLREGSLGGDGNRCVLTCNWHNWKFDLASGETLVGGDKLRRFPVRSRDARIEIDVVPESLADRRQAVLAGLTRALHEDDSDRQLREVARLMQLGIDPLDAVRTALAWAQDRLEFGATHAIAAASDWLQLAAAASPEDRLIAYGEILGHLSDDARDRSHYPLAAGTDAWNEEAFAAAIEAQDEASAMRLMRGGLVAALSTDEWRRVLARMALAHYADFGHAVIYSIKVVELIGLLGSDSAAPLLAMLVRSLCFASREDLLPEFRSYAEQLAGWGTGDAGHGRPDPAALRQSSPRSAMLQVRNWSALADTAEIWPVLLETAGWQLLQADEDHFQGTDLPLAQNANWLDLTHALTFADAGAQAAMMSPDLWPAVMLQLACFIGRNSGFVDAAIDTSPYAVADLPNFWAGTRQDLLDHGRGRFIVSAHLIKTAFAAERLAADHPALAGRLAAAVNRFLHAPLKERHIRRTARQMLDLVARE
ncbi:Rieske (2Fe-2S) protein [Dongia sp.]|uniref:Rieske (2Fe-2S) protein n=1 Tax=Dongia sp. TaxID=1977262 RepID=UPI0035B3F264